jgi:hypothetical protein
MLTFEGQLHFSPPLDTETITFPFADTKVSPLIVYAFHALALDEHRGSFPPIVWEAPTNAPGTPNPLLKVLKQCWFPGAHANICGSYEDAGLSNIALIWMISQLSDYSLLNFDENYLSWLIETVQNEWYYNNGIRGWGMGRVYNSMPKDAQRAIVTHTPDHYRKKGAAEMRL